MPEMIQIITWMLAFYLVVKGLEILQIALASNRDERTNIIKFGVLALVACIVAAIAFVGMQDQQVKSMQDQQVMPLS